MQTQRVETNLVVAKGSDGRIYDLHQIAHQSRPKLLGPHAPWTNERVEWLTSAGALVETADETVFRLVGADLVLTRIGRIESPATVSDP